MILEQINKYIMRKIFFTFFVFIISINYTYAGACTIKSKSSPALLEYIENNRSIINNISTQLADETEKKESDEKSLKNEVENEYTNVKSSAVKVYNQIFSFDSYYSYFKYFASFPISNEVPHEVKRDYRLLEAEWKGIKFYLDSIIKNWQTDFIIKWICKDIKVNCDFPDEIKAWELIWKLTANNEAVLDLFRNTVIGEMVKNKVPLKLVNPNFEMEIQTNYNIEAYSKCSEEGWFFEKISKSIKEIWTLNAEAKGWIQKWRDSIDLMLWNDTKNEKYAESEKRLLLNELSKQWISWDSQANSLDALDKYNSEWFSKNNNFIKNTFNNTRLKLENKLKDFKDDVIWDFFEKKWWDNIDINSTINAQKNSTNTNELKEKIDNMYLELLPLSAVSESNVTNLRSRLIKTHIDLSNSISTLNRVYPKSEKVCNQQDNWKWNCETN